MKLIYTIFIGMLVVGVICLCLYGCDNRQVTEPTIHNQQLNTHQNGNRIKVIDANGIIHYADSTQDKLINDMWVKTIYINGEIDVQYPFELNKKGFTTK